MRFEWEIIRDWHDEYGFFPDEENESEFFVGTVEELDNYVRQLRECGCTNIFTNCLGKVDVEEQVEEEEEDRYGDDWEEYVDPWDLQFIRRNRGYTPSASAGDYGPSNPWDAPGMKLSDFI